MLAYSVPTLLIYGSKDPIANRKDVRRLARVFQQTGVLLGTMEIPTYDHNDFTLAADGFEFFFEYVLDRVEGAACAAEGGRRVLGRRRPTRRTGAGSCRLARGLSGPSCRKSSRSRRSKSSRILCSRKARFLDKTRVGSSCV